MKSLSDCDSLVLLRRLRRKFNDRDSHHPNCEVHEDKPCDCYNRPAMDAHLILDELEKRLKETRHR